MRTHRLLVNLDSILDTRLASIAKVSEELATTILDTGKYHSRRHNNITHISTMADNPTIVNAFNNRDTETLKMAGPTSIISLIKDLVEKYRVNFRTYNDVTKITLDLNTWPYKLNYDEKEVFKEVLKSELDLNEIKTVFIPIGKMSLQRIAVYQTVIWHEIDEWASIHLNSLTFTGARNTVFYHPEILVHDLDNAHKLEPLKAGEALKIVLLKYIELECIPLSIYSIIPPS